MSDDYDSSGEYRESARIAEEFAREEVGERLQVNPITSNKNLSNLNESQLEDIRELLVAEFISGLNIGMEFSDFEDNIKSKPAAAAYFLEGAIFAKQVLQYE